MPEKLVRIELRMEQGLVDKLDLWARQHGLDYSRSETIRTLIENSMKQELSYGDKLNLYMGLKLIKQSCKDERTNKIIDNAITAIEDGHDWALSDELFRDVTKNSDDPKDVHFVFLVLSMFQNILGTFNKLDKTDQNFVIKNIGYEPKFDGFDGNDEFNLLSITEYILINLQRYEGVFDTNDLNAHMNKKSTYEHMLKVYDKKNKMKLTKEDIVDIFGNLKSKNFYD